jgi:DNA-binding HxlR family transcriptional regulator
MENKKEEMNQLDTHHYCSTHSFEEKCSGGCHILNFFSLFGKRHTMPIIRILLLRKVLRFNELLEFIGGSPRTLSIRLKEMEDFKLITRTVFNEIPMRVEYRLTESGQDLQPMFDLISEWAYKHSK